MRPPVQIPSELDFLAALGIEPVDSIPAEGGYHYLIQSPDGERELDINFSAIVDFFQLRYRVKGEEVVYLSSEKLQSIELFHDKNRTTLKVIFDIDGVDAEAVVALTPQMHCSWSLLKRS